MEAQEPEQHNRIFCTCYQNQFESNCHPGLPGNEIYTSKSILLTLGYLLGNGCENTLGKTPTAATAAGASVQTYYYISIVKVQSASCEKFGGSSCMSWALVDLAVTVNAFICCKLTKWVRALMTVKVN